MHESETIIAHGLLALIGAMSVLIVEAEPTGTTAIDVGWSLLLGAAVPLFATRARRWTHVWAGVITAAAAGLSVWAIFGVVAAIIGLIQQQRGRDELLSGVAGVAVLQSAMHIAPLASTGVLSTWGIPTAIAGVALAPYARSGFSQGTRTFRRWSRFAIIGVASIVILGVAGFGLSALSARNHINQGVDAARGGLQAARTGDQQRASQLLDISVGEFAIASDGVAGFLSRPAALVPIAAQHRRSVIALSADATSLARSAKAAIGTADVERLRVQDGRVDLALVDELAGAITEVNQDLLRTQQKLRGVERDWLVPPLLDAIDDIRVELAATLDESLLAAQALEVVPGLLGAGGTQRYFVSFGQPAESREFGGFVGAYAIVTATEGTIELEEAADINEFVREVRLAEVNVDTDSQWLAGYEIPRFPQNLTGSPDISTVGKLTIDVASAALNRDFHGMFYVDPAAIGAFVDLLGGVEPPAIGRPLNGPEAVGFLLKDQYAELENRVDRKALLVSVLEETFSTLASANLPGPERLGEALGPVARAGRLQVWTTDDAQNAFLERVFLLRPFPANDGSDFLGVVQTNGAANKLDAYISRRIDYAVDYDPESGRLRSTVAVELTSSVPGALPSEVAGLEREGLRPGDSRVLLSVMTPHAVREVRVKGGPVPRSVFTELGYNRALLSVDVLPGESVDVEFDLEGSVWPGNYVLDVINQPLPNDDELRVSVTPAQGWELNNRDGSDPSDISVTLSEDLTFVLEANRE